jgi:hypothetical protein
MALLLRLALPQTQTTFVRMIMQVLFVPFVPAFILLAMLGDGSLLGQGGDDCLGYTVISERKSP